MNATEIKTASLPPVTLARMREGYRRACAEQAEREARAAATFQSRKVEPTAAEKHRESARRTLRDMPFNAACRTVKRMNAKMAAQKYPREQRAAAEKLLNIINR